MQLSEVPLSLFPCTLSAFSTSKSRQFLSQRSGCPEKGQPFGTSQPIARGYDDDEDMLLMSFVRRPGTKG
jgi:hypothetical protein